MNKLRDLFGKEDPEKREKRRLKRLQDRTEMSIAYQLGYYVGEQIVDKFLLTLSCDDFGTRKQIQVTIGEADELKRLTNVWFEKSQSSDDKENSKPEWDAYRAYHNMLLDKYLPQTIDCHFQLLYVSDEDMVEFKSGLGCALWNCDCSHYAVEADKIGFKLDEDGFFTIITLNRG
jgi:hypothetical protein